MESKQKRIIAKLENISASINNYALLNSLNINFEAGKLYSVIGPNGAGKSSLVKLLGRDLKSSAGNITVFDKNISQWQAKDYARQVAILPQQSELNFPFKVEEVVALGRMPHDTGMEVDAQIVNKAIEALDIKALRNRLFPSLSGGEKQRVQLARVLSQIWSEDIEIPRLLILDEPSNSLDISHQYELLQTIKNQLNGNFCIIVVLHDLSLISRFSDEVIALKNGSLYAQGTVEEVITKEHLQNLFSMQCEIIPHPSTGKPMVAL